MSEFRIQGRSFTAGAPAPASDPLYETRAQLEQAEQFRKSGKLEQARKLCEPLVARYGDYFGALHTAGLIYADMGKYSMALGFLVRAAMLNPRSLSTLTALSGVYLRLGAREMAAHTLEQAKAINPRDVGVLATLGEVYTEEREFELAEEAYRNALELEPSFQGAAVGLGTCCSQLGRFQEAADLFEALVKKRTKSLDPLFALNLLPHTYVSIDVLKELDRIERTAGESGVDFDTSVRFLRAAFLNKAGSHASAWKFLHTANAILFNEKEAERLTKLQKESLAWLQNNNIKARGSESVGNMISLFILGPSRSGKTSMEKLVSTLDGVKRGYENPIVENSVRRTFQSAGFLNTAAFPALPPQFYSMCRDFYLDELGRRAGSARAFTNTHPAHIHNAGRIATVFPNVRFIFVKRNADDIALRIYMRKYRTGNAYAYNLRCIREHISWYHEMMDLLAEKLSDRVRIVRYEDMVAQPTAALKVASDLCGLAMTEKPLPEIGDDRGCAEPYREFMAAALN